MPSLFNRKSSDATPEAAKVATDGAAPPESAPATDAPAEPATATASGGAARVGARPAPRTSKAHTASKRERGVVTPKRVNAGARRVEPPPATRREAYKRLREKERAERAERRQAMLAGDERYMLARDRGPERALVRDLVDSRHTVGTWFFGGALVVLIGAQPPMPLPIRFAANLLWVVLAGATIIDSLLIARRISKAMRERFPKTGQRPAGLYFYGIVRGMTFRRLRMPRPRLKIGERP